MPDIILIADDLTGAADSAAPFASYGIQTRLLLDQSSAPGDGVSALSTNSRDLELEPAREAVLAACHRVTRSRRSDAMLFKKIDSTLRGHPVEELQIVLQQFDIERLLLSPAFPAQGRSTLNGRQHVHGTPLGESSFTNERICDDLTRLFGGLCGDPAVSYPLDVIRGDTRELHSLLSRPGIHIPDIATDADMSRCLDAALDAGIMSFCSAGGMGRALAQRLGSERDGLSFMSRPAAPVLIVAGSRNQATLDQVEAVRRAGTPVVRLGTDGEWERTVREHLKAGSSVVVSSMPGEPSPTEPDAVRDRLGKGIMRVVERVRPGVLVLTGGDVAAAVCQALEVDAITLRGELEPGVPSGKLEGGVVPGLVVVTKAGGFGDRGTFSRLLDSVRRE